MQGGRAWGDGSACGVHAGRARLKAVGARARAERTANMPHMVVTLDVSNLSTWLNADAACRAERRGHAMREEVRPPGGVRALGGGETSGVHGEGPAQGCGAKAVGAGARAERTENMAYMFVTLDVLKLSGWSNALASCRVERRACDARREAVRPGRREGVG